MISKKSLSKTIDKSANKLAQSHDEKDTGVISKKVLLPAKKAKEAEDVKPKKNIKVTTKVAEDTPAKASKVQAKTVEKKAPVKKDTVTKNATASNKKANPKKSDAQGTVKAEEAKTVEESYDKTTKADEHVEQVADVNSGDNGIYLFLSILDGSNQVEDQIHVDNIKSEEDNKVSPNQDQVADTTDQVVNQEKVESEA